MLVFDSVMGSATAGAEAKPKTTAIVNPNVFITVPRKHSMIRKIPFVECCKINRRNNKVDILSPADSVTVNLLFTRKLPKTRQVHSYRYVKLVSI